jgi:hypothetical protein
MKKIAALIGIALISGSAFAADAQKVVVAKADVIVLAKADVKAPVKRVTPAPAPATREDPRFSNASLESFSCCSLPQ